MSSSNSSEVLGPCPVCGAGPEQSSDPSHPDRSVCYCGHPRYYDYRITDHTPSPRWRCPECGSTSTHRGERQTSPITTRAGTTWTRHVWCDLGHAWIGRTDDPDDALERNPSADRRPLPSAPSPSERESD